FAAIARNFAAQPQPRVLPNNCVLDSTCYVAYGLHDEGALNNNRKEAVVEKIHYIRGLAGLSALALSGSVLAQRDVPRSGTDGLSYTYLQAAGVWRNIDPFEDTDALIENWDDGRGWS